MIENRLVMGQDDIELPPKYQGRDDAEDLKERYKDMLFEPGEAIGIVAAQSLSEPATQMTMETYHSAGAAKVSITQGLPRMIEIVNARRNPKTPVMNIWLEDGHQTKEDAKEVAAKLKEVTLDDIIREDTLDLMQLELSFVFDETVLDEYNVDTDDVVATLKDKLSSVTVQLEDNELTLAPTGDDYDLTDLQDMKQKAMDIRLQGFKGIEDVVILQEEGEWRVQTAGINLRKTLKLDKVDATRTRCNDLFEFKKVFGVEATRNLILSELQSTLEEQGMAVDVRWLMLTADIMTKEGDINGATRYGICGNKDSVLARAAFEETKKHLRQAAMGGEKDPLNSIVENIIMGQVIPAGTGKLELTAKPSKAPESVLEEREKKRKEIKEQKEKQMAELEAEQEAEETDLEELVDETIADIKDYVDEHDVDLEALLEAETENKDRKTLKSWLEDRIAEE
ncbi:MAG: DNA-directed RNA polymerase subunit A'' [Candidatus Nanohaloarchaeota archaeon QJJ-5]|nr:DNA-directed RNA polymerase subunit A'' [Candidatus Nanohaloarchaeota archaeon QJJ-5]